MALGSGETEHRGKSQPRRLKRKHCVVVIGHSLAGTRKCFKEVGDICASCCLCKDKKVGMSVR